MERDMVFLEMYRGRFLRFFKGSQEMRVSRGGREGKISRDVASHSGMPGLGSIDRSLQQLLQAKRKVVPTFNREQARSYRACGVTRLEE
jgi:hypothetical protein